MALSSAGCMGARPKAFVESAGTFYVPAWHAGASKAPAERTKAFGLFAHEILGGMPSNALIDRDHAARLPALQSGKASCRARAPIVMVAAFPIAPISDSLLPPLRKSKPCLQ